MSLIRQEPSNQEAIQAPVTMMIFLQELKGLKMYLGWLLWHPEGVGGPEDGQACALVDEGAVKGKKGANKVTHHRATRMQFIHVIFFV